MKNKVVITIEEECEDNSVNLKIDFTPDLNKTIFRDNPITHFIGIAGMKAMKELLTVSQEIGNK